VTCDFASDISTSDAGLDGELMAREGKLKGINVELTGL
jgi:hypothetical protein